MWPPMTSCTAAAPRDAGADTIAVGLVRRARRSRTTGAAARCARCSTPARPGASFAHGSRHTHADGGAGSSSGWASATSFDAERARVAAAVVHGRAQELRRASAVLGAAPRRRADAPPPRSSRARCSPPTASTATASARPTRTRDGSSCSSPIHADVGGRGAARGDRGRGGERRARPAEHAGQRPRPRGAGRARAGARRGARRPRRSRSRAARRCARAGWAPSPAVAQGSDARAAADHAALRAGRARRARCSASSARR